MRKLFVIFCLGVLSFYALASFFGWELANGGTRSRFAMPYIFTGGGYRGGK